MKRAVHRYFEGRLPSGVAYLITDSRKKSPGLAEGHHLIVTIDTEVTPVTSLSEDVMEELTIVAIRYARTVSRGGTYRFGGNAEGVGRRFTTKNPPHVHLMFPEGDDVLPFFVERNVPGGDNVI